MAIIAGFFVLVAIGWATTKAADAAWQMIRSQYQARNGRFRAAHPTSNRAAAAGAAAAATLRHGTGPALQAFRDDWRKHYALRRDAIQSKYAPKTEPPAPPTPPPPAQSKGLFDDDPNYQQLKAIRDSGYTGWIDQDMQKVDGHGRPLDEKPRPLRLVPDLNEPSSTGAKMPNLNTAEVSKIADIRKALGDFQNHMKVEVDDAVAARQRAKDNQSWLRDFAERSRAVLDNDPETQAYIHSLLEPAQARVQAAEMHAQAADRALAASQASLNGVNQHRGLEDAVQATPQASSNTAVYAGN